MPTDHMQHPVREFAQWTQWTEVDLVDSARNVHSVHSRPLRPLTRVRRASDLLWLADDSWLLVRYGFGQRQFSSLVHYRVFNRLRPGVGRHTLETRRAGCSDSAQS